MRLQLEEVDAVEQPVELAARIATTASACTSGHGKRSSGVYAPAKATVHGSRFVFGLSNYVAEFELPVPTNEDGSLVRVPPSGSVLTVTVPDFTNNQVHQIGDLAPIIQEVVSAEWYDGTQNIALAVGPSSTAVAGDERSWDSRDAGAADAWKLVVSYRDPKVYVVA